jgi:hypothetical protein
MIEGGINCLFPFGVNGCAHPAELLNEYGKDLRIMGGVEKMQLAAGRDAIDAYLNTLVPLVNAVATFRFVTIAARQMSRGKTFVLSDRKESCSA